MMNWQYISFQIFQKWKYIFKILFFSVFVYTHIHAHTHRLLRMNAREVTAEARSEA